MKKKIVTIMLMLVFALTLPLTACSPKGNNDKDFDDDFDDEEQYTITFYGWGDAEEQENYQKLIAEFMKENKNIIVSYSADTSTTYMQSLQSMANNLPDVFYMPDTEFLQWADAGRLLNLSSGVNDAELSKIWPEAVDKYYYNRDNYKLGQSDGAKLYGLPKDMGPFTLVYNKTLLNSQAQKNGLSADDLKVLDPKNPMSWEQFRTLLKKLDSDPNDKIYGISHYEVEAAVYSNNADFYSEDTTTQKITDKNFTDALQFIADLYLKDKVMPSADDQVSTNGYQRFKAGGSIFSFMGPWDCASFWKLDNLDYEVVPVPYGPAEGAKSVAWVGSMAYSVSAKTKAQGAALRLAKYLSMSETAQRKAYELGQQVPNLIDMATDEYVNNTNGILTGSQLRPANRDVFVDTIDGFKNVNDKVGGKARARYYTYDSIWYQNFLDELKDLWTGKRSAETICAAYKTTFQEQLDDMLAQYRG